MSRIWVLASALQATRSDGEATTETQYAICLEPTKRNRFFKSASRQCVIFDLHNLRSGVGPAPENNPESKPDLKVLLAHTDHVVSPSKVHALLRKTPTSESSSSWLDASMASLQGAGLIDSFSSSKFRVWMDDALHEHVASGRSEALELDYASLLKSWKRTKQMMDREPSSTIDSPPHKTFLGFWISSPYDEPGERSFGSERRRDPYGGLM